MSHRILALTAFLLFPFFAFAHEEPVMCTMEYAPVCAEKDGVRKTYGNACAAGAADATVIYRGECEAGGGSSGSQGYMPPSGCTAWFDGCNSCSKGPDGQTACTLRACVGEPAPGYCTAYGHQAPAPSAEPIGSASSPVAGEPQEAAASGTPAESAPPQGFFSRLWASVASWFAGLF